MINFLDEGGERKKNEIPEPDKKVKRNSFNIWWRRVGVDTKRGVIENEVFSHIGRLNPFPRNFFEDTTKLSVPLCLLQVVLYRLFYRIFLGLASF